MSSDRGKFLVRACGWLAWSSLALVPFLWGNLASFRPLFESFGLLVIAVWFWIVSIGPGWRVLRESRAFPDDGASFRLGLTRLFLASGIGLGLLAVVMLVTGMVLGVDPLTALFALTLLVLFATPSWLEVFREIQAVCLHLARREWSCGEIAGVALFLGIALLELPAALTPTVYPDTWRYHFGLTRLFEQMGRIAPIKDFAEANLSSNWQMIYMPQLLLAGEGVASVFNWMTLPLASAAVGLAAGSRRACLAAAIVMVSTPYLLEVSGLGNNDLGVTFFIALMWLALRGTALRNGVMWAGVLGGIAVGTKYPALVPAVAAIAAWFFFSAGIPGERMRGAGHFALGGFVGYLPWFIRNSVWTGDPFYPTFTKYLPWCGEEGHWVSKLYSKEMSLYGGGMSSQLGAAGVTPEWIEPLAAVLRPLLAPWRATVAEAAYFESDVGLIYWCMLPILIWAVWKARGLRGAADLRIPTTAAFLAGMVWVVGPQVTRFLGPFTPAAALAVALAWEALRDATPDRLSRRAALTAALALVGVNVWQSLTAVSGFSEPWAVLLHQTSRQDYLRQRVPVFRVAAWCGHPDRVNFPVLLFGEEGVYAFDNPVRVSGPFDRKWIVDQAERATSARQLAATLKMEGIRYIVVNVKKVDDMERRFGYASWPSDPARGRMVRMLTEEAETVRVEGPLTVFDLGRKWSTPPPPVSN